jgi:serine phosphatase RsbU (regulator of sigma subunit)/Tfp pilus assembly protein PilF
LIWPFCLSAREPEQIDSLTGVVNSAVADTVKIRTWMKLASCYKDSLPYKSIECLEKGYALVQKNTSKSVAADLTNELGHRLYYVGDYEKASRYFLQAIDYCKAYKNTEGVANCLNNLGSIYIELQDNKKALLCYQEAYAIYEENLKTGISDSDHIAMATGNMGRCYYYMNDFYKAKEYYNKCLAISEKTGNTNRISLMVNNLGSIFAEQKQYDSALVYFNRSYQLQLQLENKPMLVTVINNIGEVYLKKNDYKSAIDFYNKALEHAREISFLDGQQVSYKGLEGSYSGLKDFQSAYKYLELYTVIKDSIFNEENTEKINEMLTRFDSEKKEQEIQLLQKEKEIRKFWQKALIIGVIVLIIIALLLYNRNKVTQKAKKIIENQKELIEEKQKEIVDSIHYAKRIQNTLFANREFMSENLSDNFVYFNPKDIVSGDFYWATSRVSATQNLFYLAVCDSTGHGVPGAFMSLLNIGFLSEAINEKNIQRPDEVLNYVRERLMNSISKEGQQDGLDGLLVCFNTSDKTVTYAAANCCPVLVSGGVVSELPYDRMPVSKGGADNSFRLFDTNLKEGDTLYLYTDGYADQFGGKAGKKFKYKQLNELLLTISALPLREQELELEKRFVDWKGNLEQVDDVCVIGIRI